MKGPYERLKYTLRRVWECPVCKHRERTEGWVTNMYCRCQREVPAPKQQCMKLVKDGVRRVRRKVVSA
jgi:hypothetical protein